LMDVETPDFPMRPYDFLLHCAYESLEKTEVKLGVLLGTDTGRVAVEGVVPESSAAAADLQKGDLLLAIDGEAIGDSFDLIYRVKQKRPGDRGTLLIEREGKEESVEVLFQEPRAMPSHGQPKE
ncbi:MAG TPA: PDZ domain-containing protein, partial [Deferrimonas sp.]